MPLARTAATLLAFSFGWTAPITLAFTQDGPGRKVAKGAAWEQDEFEEKSVGRAVERAVKAADTEGSRWLRELTKAFPNQVGPALTEEAVGRWFDLLAAGGKEWRRDASPNRQVAELFDRAVQRLELGPVPSLRRDEFLHYATKALLPRNRPPEKPGERFAEADRVFRVLDRDGSGVLEPAEWTERLRAESGKVDANGDRRIDADEYRAYFERRVNDGVEAAAKVAAGGSAGNGPAKAAGGLPAWFAELDTDKDGQVGLYEWRAAGRPIAEFQAMDLDGDGLLTPDEYHRYVRMLDAERKPVEPERTPPLPPGDRRADRRDRKP